MKTKVIFKKFANGEVIALFPDDQSREYIGSYMHIGQHSDAHPDLIKELEDATEEEYHELEEELTVIGYDLTAVPWKESN